MRRSEARSVLTTATQRLQEAARERELAAGTTSRSGRLDHIARDYQALAAESLRVVEFFGPGREQVQTDWGRVYAICDGIRRLEVRQDAELREEIRHELCAHDQRQRDLCATELGELADRVSTDPGMWRIVHSLHDFLHEPAE